MRDSIKIDRCDGVLTLVIDRPEKKNAFTDGMYAVMADAIEGAEGDPAARVILIRAEGELFTSGNDLNDFAAVAMGGTLPDNGHRFMRAIAQAGRPIVAAVQGRAVGIGATMLLHCDFVLLAEDAELVTPFVNLALVPEAASTRLLPERIGHLRAFRMFALGEPVLARDALAWGLATQLVPSQDLAAAAQEVAQRLATRPLGALMATKRLMRDGRAMAASLQAECVELDRRLSSDEAREAFAAFAQRRAPDFLQFG